eukprot:11025412-Ditylum_brightwellii.AAC.1
MLYRGNLVKMLMSTLGDQSQVMDRLKQCFLPDTICDEDAMMSVFAYLIKTYMNMRGQDFVRRLMGHSKMDPIIGQIADRNSGQEQKE